MQIRRKWKVLFLLLSCYCVVWIWTFIHTQTSFSLSNQIHLLKPFFKQKCPMKYVFRNSKYEFSQKSVTDTSTEDGVCQIQDNAKQHDVDIQMESEWNNIGTTYPQYVYTVSGWVQVLEIPSYNVKGKDRPLKVIIVPHSHQDPGWLMSYESYYRAFTAKTLSVAVDHLSKHAERKFIWAEMSYLSKWWDGASQLERKNLQQLINNGQFEIVNGGWVMSDEATVHFQSMLDQLIEGQQWLNTNLGTVPASGWSIDQFGYSPTMTYMMKRSGIKNLVIQRVHYAIKKHFAARQNLEFYWRQVWDSKESTDLFCHLMPFLSYNIVHSCGPDPFVCCKFDFTRNKCFWGTKSISPKDVTENNVKELSWQLWEQFQKKSQIYKTNVLLVPHGDDFRYSDSTEWDQQLGNLEKLMKYMNTNPNMYVDVKFGTLADYFKYIDEDKQYFPSNRINFPTFSGDFFPYNDRDDQYWVGYFSSRPMPKHIARLLQSRVRLAEILYTISLIFSKKNNLVSADVLLKSKFPDLQAGRRALGLFQHHDAITGTARQIVMEDYSNILESAVTKIDTLLSIVTNVFMVKSTEPAKELLVLSDEKFSRHYRKKNKILPVEKSTSVIVINPLSVSRTDVVSVFVSHPNVKVVESTTGHGVTYQVNPVIAANNSLIFTEFEIQFEINVESLSLKTYILVPLDYKPTKAFASIYLVNQNATGVDSGFITNVVKPSKANVEFHNKVLSVSVSTCTGLVQHIIRVVDNVHFNMQIKFMSYGTGSWKNPYRDKSGAYIFLPDGPAQDLNYSNPPMIALIGHLSSAVYTKLPGALHKMTLFNVSGPIGSAVHIDNDVDISKKTWNNKEIIMRLETDIVNDENEYCVDLNGFQMHRKKTRSKLTPQGNFHPLTTAAFLEDLTKMYRITLLTSEAHGVASLRKGWLEVVLDRRLIQDDWRGLNEGLTDNVRTPSRFMIVVERSTVVSRSNPPSCFLSSASHLLSQHLNNPIVLAVHNHSSKIPDLRSERLLLKKQLPCALNLLNLRSIPNITGVSALLLLHHVGIDCTFGEVPQMQHACEPVDEINLEIFEGISSVSVTEMNLSGVLEKSVVNGTKEQIPPMEIRTYKMIF